MLYSAFAHSYSQDEVAEATGIRPHIPTRGCRVDQLATAVQKLTPDFILLGKYDSSIEDLYTITTEWAFPVAVEWRGTFLEPDGHIWHEGHYSIVEKVDLAARKVHLIDPFNGKNIAHQGGIIDLDEFVRRWWDDNYFPAAGTVDLTDPDGWTEHIFTDHLIFALVPQAQSAALLERGMKPASAELSRQSSKQGRTLDPTLSYRPTGSDQ